MHYPADSSAPGGSSGGSTGTTGATGPSNAAGARHIIASSRRYSDISLDSTTLETFITRQQLNDTLATGLRSFYNSRDFQFAWFARDGMTEQASSFRSLYDYSKDSSTNRKWLDRKLDSLMSSDSLSPSAEDPGIVRTELLMTWRFINYLTDRYPDKKERDIALTTFVPSEKQYPLTMAQALADNDKGEDATANPWYLQLKTKLKDYLALARSGDWKPLPVPRKKYIHRRQDSLVVQVRERLHQMAYLDKVDSSARYDTALRKAIRNFQNDHGLMPDGNIGPATVKKLNTPIPDLIRQILVNLERMRWLPPRPAGQLILINIPEFSLHVLDDQHKVFDMKIIVGKEGHNTILFAGSLNQLIFNPYWNIPSSIVKKEILPHLKKDKDYLKKNDMEITGYVDGMPVIRQLPGEKNELGKIKFLFPNSFHIYLHDTPHKGLFNETKRAYSHGCIRLENARRLADYLLQSMPAWTKEKVDSVLNSGKEFPVRLQTPVPVLLCYFTIWVGEKDKCRFREDIYGHDARLAARLFEP